jgi:hypothetical protein
MNSDYQIFYFDNFIENYAKMLGKPVIYLRSYGWNNSSDVDKINQSIETWTNILPLDILTYLKNSEFCFIEVDDIADAAEFLQNSFPTSQSDVAYPELYIHYTLCNEIGQVILSN